MTQRASLSIDGTLPVVSFSASLLGRPYCTTTFCGVPQSLPPSPKRHSTAAGAGAGAGANGVEEAGSGGGGGGNSNGNSSASSSPSRRWSSKTKSIEAGKCTACVSGRVIFPQTGALCSCGCYIYTPRAPDSLTIYAMHCLVPDDLERTAPFGGFRTGAARLRRASEQAPVSGNLPQNPQYALDALDAQDGAIAAADSASVFRDDANVAGVVAPPRCSRPAGPTTVSSEAAAAVVSNQPSSPPTHPLPPLAAACSQVRVHPEPDPPSPAGVPGGHQGGQAERVPHLRCDATRTATSTLGWGGGEPSLAFVSSFTPPHALCAMHSATHVTMRVGDADWCLRSDGWLLWVVAMGGCCLGDADWCLQPDAV